MEETRPTILQMPCDRIPPAPSDPRQLFTLKKASPSVMRGPNPSPARRSLRLSSLLRYSSSSSSDASLSTPSSPFFATMDASEQSEAPRRPSTFSIEEFSDLCNTALDLGSIPEPHLSFLPNLPFSQENLNNYTLDPPVSPTLSSGIHSFEDPEFDDDDVVLDEFMCAANSSEDLLGTKHRGTEGIQQRGKSVARGTVTSQGLYAGPYAASDCAHGGGSLAPSGKNGFFKNLKTRASALVLSKISSSHTQQEDSSSKANYSPGKTYSPPSSPRSPTRPPPSSFPRFLDRTMSGNPKSFLDINDDVQSTNGLPRPSFSSSVFRKPLYGRPSTPVSFNNATPGTCTATPGPESGHRGYFPDPHPYPSTSSPRRAANPIRSLFTSKSTGHFPKPSKPIEVADYAAPLSRLNSSSSVLSTYTAPRPAPPKPEGSGYADLYGRRPSAPEDYAYARIKEKEAMRALPPIPVRPRADSQASFIHPLALASYKSKSRSRSKFAAVLPQPLQIPKTRIKGSKSLQAARSPHGAQPANGWSSASNSGTATPSSVIDVKRQDPSFFHITAGGDPRRDDSVPPVPPLPASPAKFLEVAKSKRSRARSGSVTSQISEALSAGLAGLGVGSRARSRSKESVMAQQKEEQAKEEALNVGRVFTPEDDPFKKADVVEVRSKKGSGYSAVSGSGSEEEGRWFVPPRMRGLGIDAHPYAGVPPMWGGPSPTPPPMMPPPTYPLPEIPDWQGLPTPPSSSIVPSSGMFEKMADGASAYPPSGGLPSARLPTPPMMGMSGRRQSFIDMDGGSVRRMRHVPTLEEVRDRTRTRSGSPFPLPLTSFTNASGDERFEDVPIEEGQSRVVFTNPWTSGGEPGRESLDRDSAVDVKWPLPPKRVVTVLVNGEDEEKEGGWHDVEQGIEFFPRKKGSLISEASTSTSFTDGSAPSFGGPAARDSLTVASGGPIIRRGSERAVIITDGDSRGWSTHPCCRRGSDDSSPTSPTSPTTRQLNGQQARAIVEKFGKGGPACAIKEERPRRSEDSVSAYYSARSSIGSSLPGSPQKRRLGKEKVVRVEEVRDLRSEDVKALLGRRGEKLRLVAAGGWRELMNFCDAFAEVRMGEKAGQILSVLVLEEAGEMSMVLEMAPFTPASPVSPRMPGHWHGTVRDEQVVSTFRLAAPTTFGEIARTCRRGLVGEGVSE
ncbi:hypothetical protein OE88DRAFT_1738088 [Heliocybe sulcata]|uniref:Uncharacterized protein n=1 Tax=Heliocybe sulcata TaxID=5364 RepID=A0A5C3MR96_9AGAM|nr:hypothetical protein OE88DRAFT_1738088 [Heliocybe sulcata]